MALCADDIELWPPDAQPVLGRAAVFAYLDQAITCSKNCLTPPTLLEIGI